MTELINKGPIVDPGLCRCCGSIMKCRLLNVEYEFSGQKEVYSDMFVDCFGLKLSNLDGDDKECLICVTCVTRLREASSFRQQVLQCEEMLLQRRICVHNQDGEISKDMQFEISIKCEETSSDLLNEDVAESGGTISDSDSDDSIPDYKQTKKRKRVKRYKNYTDDDLKKAVAAVRNKTMTFTKAYRTYNLPRSTLSFKLNEKEEASSTSGVHSTFIKEIQTILKFTNATPFKCRTAKLYCLYCTDGQVYEEPEELRNHINTKHIRHRIRHIEHIMRPAWIYEILRIDIYNLSCTVCCETLESWDDMYTHLEEQHNTTFEYAHKKLIPYILTDQNYICAKCNKIFKSYYQLDIHMNNHFKNHQCLDCGDSFKSETRLKQHLRTHQKGHFPCEICGVSFTLENYRKKHYENLHERINKIKCNYCNERFQGEYARHLHVVEKHKEKVKTYTCSVCDRNFTWRAYYIKHIKKVHNKTKVYNCEICKLKFDNAKARREHNAKTHKKPSTPKSNIKMRKANDELVRDNKKVEAKK